MILPDTLPSALLAVEQLLERGTSVQTGAAPWQVQYIPVDGDDGGGDGDGGDGEDWQGDHIPSSISLFLNRCKLLPGLWGSP